MLQEHTVICGKQDFRSRCACNPIRKLIAFEDDRHAVVQRRNKIVRRSDNYLARAQGLPSFGIPLFVPHEAVQLLVSVGGGGLLEVARRGHDAAISFPRYPKHRLLCDGLGPRIVLQS